MMYHFDMKEFLMMYHFKIKKFKYCGVEFPQRLWYSEDTMELGYFPTTADAEFTPLDKSKHHELMSAILQSIEIEYE